MGGRLVGPGGAGALGGRGEAVFQLLLHDQRKEAARNVAADPSHPNSWGPWSGRSARPRVCLRCAYILLQTIADAEALRKSINALMQYLKRKQLAAKAGLEFDAPYTLTDQGRAVLEEMALRGAA